MKEVKFMIFRYGKNDFKSLKRGQEHSYLLTNGLGGFSSTSIINSVTRNDHALFMACVKAPNNRKSIISKVFFTKIITINIDLFTKKPHSTSNYQNAKGVYCCTFIHPPSDCVRSV